MTDINKDVVSARVKLDITKISPAFKSIDEGTKKNTDSFKTLNSEITQTEKTYANLAKSMDKMVMNSDERKKKVMAESNALVAQRKAQAEFINAKNSNWTKLIRL